MAGVQVGEFCGGSGFGGPALAGEDRGRERACAVTRGVAAGAEFGDVDPFIRRDEERPLGGQGIEVEITEGVLEAVVVVLDVRWHLEVLAGVDAVWGFLGEGAGGVVGGVGDVVVDVRAVVGEQFGAVGEQPGVFVGADVVVVEGVEEVFRCGGEQLAGWPVGGVDGGDEGGPGGVGGDRFGGGAAEDAVQLCGPGWS